uniref:Immunoglobulin superfamily member 9 n=1 Tax=Strix occidentalis caurina TaxID=311401 RepID=A0A8D0FLL0_STROC
MAALAFVPRPFPAPHCASQGRRSPSVAWLHGQTLPLPGEAAEPAARPSAAGRPRGGQVAGGRRVRIEEGASLRIDLLRAEDQGWYECRVLFLDRHSTDADFQNGTWIHLTVNAPPTFLETPPAFVEVRDQDALSLTCTAAGNPQPVVIWKRSDLAVQSGDTVQVRNGTLSIAVVERTSAGTYTCHASSKEGTITHTTRVLVQGPPVIVVPPQNITVNVSQDVFLACQAEAYPGNLTYTWFQGNSNVFHLSHLQARVRVLVDGSLLLQRTTPDDAGKYTCIPSNGLWKPPSASAFVTVLYPAQVTTMLPETPLPKGMQGVIRCPARANPPLLSVSWTRDGRPLELDKLPGWSTRPDGSIVIATGNDDALGVYTCTPYNSYGTAGTSQPTRVLLKDPPAFTVRPKEEYFQEVGRELVIPCAAHGDPPPTVAWLKVGAASGAQVDGNSSLVFRPLVKEQHGVWECVATNQVASVSTATSVHVLGESSVPGGAGIARVCPGVDTLDSRVPHLLRVKHPLRAHHDWVSLSVPVGAQHLMVENLQPDMSYQFSVLAQNKLGSGPFSQIVTSVPMGFPVTTVPPEPPAMTMRIFLSPPQALTANETVRGVLLQWEPPAQFSVALSGYALELRQDKGGWEVLDRSIPSTETQILVPGLIKDAFYEFRLVAFAGSYISDPSNTVNVSTAGMEVYPSRTQLPELLPQPVLAGVIGGICFLSVAVIFSTVAACIMNRRRAARIQKRRQDPPLVFSPSKKLSLPHNSRGSGSPDSTVKLKLQPSPYRSLRRTLLWGEKSHVGEHVPLERICRGPDGRFVVETNTRPQESGCGVLPYTKPEPYLQRDPLGPSSSSPVDEAAALCIVNISPVQPASPPAQSGILQYLSLPFFKEMCVDGDWPPPEELAEPGHASGQPQPEPAASPPPALPGTGGSPQRAGTEAVPSASTAEPSTAPGRPPDPSPLEKLPRGSLTSQSSGRGSASFLRPPSLAPSLGVSRGRTPDMSPAAGLLPASPCVPPPLGARPDARPRRRNTSVDENYEWDAEFALESDILEALQLYRSGDPARPVSTIALRDLERQSECGPPRPP